jgi:hypothetical protein
VLLGVNPLLRKADCGEVYPMSKAQKKLNNFPYCDVELTD